MLVPALLLVLPAVQADPPPPRRPPRGAPQRYSLEQAMSDRAQLHTLAFDGLAFLTGDFAADTFLPPGKVSDHFGFQFMRDIDAREGGHNPSFLTKVALNVLSILDTGQRGRLLDLARAQQADLRRFAELRFPLIRAFRRTLEGDLPTGARRLSRTAVQAASAELYALDGRLSFQRAQRMAEVLRSLDARQRAALEPLRFGDSGTWPEAGDPLDRRALPHDVHVAVMTYASEMFSWAKGSLEADTYFCPERHGMYFGGFGLKTAPAMGKRDYAISTALTGDQGEAFLRLLEPAQRRLLDEVVEQQRADLKGIAELRREIARELRRFLEGGAADEAKVVALARRYGELDGHISWLYASAFARVARSLSPAQKRSLAALRGRSDGPRGPFLYSEPIRMPQVENTDRFFERDAP